jgi:hypothetical protein
MGEVEIQLHAFLTMVLERDRLVNLTRFTAPEMSPHCLYDEGQGNSANTLVR